MNTKKLDLGLGFLGGAPTIFARNIIEHGDFATVAHLYGKSCKSIEDNDKILIEMRSKFDNLEYLNQVKAFLTKTKSNVTFANDCPTGSFLDAEIVLNAAMANYPKLMNFEKKAILSEKTMLHKIYLSALDKNEDRYGMPNDFIYDINSGHLYPIIQVYRTVRNMV